jgi:RimJ/RimL family protein N-acetyltransferase
VVGRGGAGRFPTPTDRLLLRPVSVEDLDALYRIWTDPAVRRTLWDGEVISKERAEAALLEGGEDFAQHGFGLWVAEEGGCMIGFCGLRRLDDAFGVEVLYGIAPGTGGAASRRRGPSQYSATVSKRPAWVAYSASPTKRTPPPGACWRRSG